MNEMNGQKKWFKNKHHNTGSHKPKEYGDENAEQVWFEKRWGIHSLLKYTDIIFALGEDDWVEY